MTYKVCGYCQGIAFWAAELGQPAKLSVDREAMTHTAMGLACLHCIQQMKCPRPLPAQEQKPLQSRHATVPMHAILPSTFRSCRSQCHNTECQYCHCFAASAANNSIPQLPVATTSKQHNVCNLVITLDVKGSVLRPSKATWLRACTFKSMAELTRPRSPPPSKQHKHTKQRKQTHTHKHTRAKATTNRN